MLNDFYNNTNERFHGENCSRFPENTSSKESVKYMNRDTSFANYLIKEVNNPNSKITSEKAALRRVSLVRKAEELLGVTIDDYMTEQKIDKLIRHIRVVDDKRHGGMENAIRHYYKFITGNAAPVVKNKL